MGVLHYVPADDFLNYQKHWNISYIYHMNMAVLQYAHANDWR